MIRIKEKLSLLFKMIKCCRPTSKPTQRSILAQKKILIRRQSTLNKLYRDALWKTQDIEQYAVLHQVYLKSKSKLESEKLIYLVPDYALKTSKRKRINKVATQSLISLAFMMTLVIIILSTINGIHDCHRAEALLTKIKTRLIIEKTPSLQNSEILSKFILDYQTIIKPRISNQLFAYKKIQESARSLSDHYLNHQLIPLLKPSIVSQLKMHNANQYNALLSALALDPNSTLDFPHYRGNIAWSMNENIDKNSLMLLSSTSTHSVTRFDNRLIEKSIQLIQQSPHPASDILSAIKASYLAKNTNLSALYTLKGYDYFQRTLKKQIKLYQILINKTVSPESIISLYQQKLIHHWHNQLSYSTNNDESNLQIFNDFLDTRHIPLLEYHNLYSEDFLFFYQHAPQFREYFQTIKSDQKSPCRASKDYLLSNENPIIKIQHLGKNVPTLANRFIQASAKQTWRSLNQACINTKAEDWLTLNTSDHSIFNATLHPMSFEAVQQWMKDADIYYKNIPLITHSTLNFILPPLQAKRYEQLQMLKASGFDHSQSNFSINRIKANSNIKSIEITADQQTLSYHYGPFNTARLKLHPKTLSLNIVLFSGETISKTYHGAMSWLALTRNGKLLNNHKYCLWIYRGVTLYISPKIICRVLDPNFWH